MRMFFDTNIWLHYKEVRTYNAADFGGGSHTILIPRVVIRELDKFKDSQKTWQKKRARRALQIIEEVGKAKGSLTLENGFTLELTKDNLTNFAWDMFNLDKDIPDHRLIASVLRYKETACVLDVILYTRDVTPRIDAVEQGIDAREFLVRYEEPEELTEEERENRDLKKQLQRFENRTPKLALEFHSSLYQQNPSVLKLQPLAQIRALSSEDIDKLVTIEERKWPIHIARLIHESQRPVNEQRKAYHQQYREYLDKMVIHEKQSALTERIMLCINNTGTSPAKDLDVEIEIPFHQISAIEPEQPNPPKEPGDHSYESINFQSIENQVPYPESLRVYDDPMGCKQVAQHFKLVKHNHTRPLDEFFITFPSLAARKSFNIRYMITCSDLPDPVTGTLHVVVEQAQL